MPALAQHPPLRTIALAFLTSLVVLAPSARPAAAEAPIRLSTEQVACNAEQLGALLARMEPLAGAGRSVEDLGPLAAGWTLFAGYADPFGAYEGLLVSSQEGSGEGPVVPERNLAFVLQRSIRQLLLNPERPTLEQVALTRERSASTLVPTGADGALTLALAPTLGGAAAGSLVIDNVVAEGDGAERATSTKPGRGLVQDRLTSPCHYGLTEEDLRLTALIERLLRVDLRGPAGERMSAAVALYRATEPDRFRLDLYPRPPSGEAASCRFSLAVDLRRTEGGRLDRAVLEAADPAGDGLPQCTTDEVGGEAFLIPATFAGATAWDRSAASPGLALGVPAGARATIADLTRLLDGSRWNRPGPEPAPSCLTSTRAQLAASPRRDLNIELMAATLGDTMLAEQGLYDRMLADQRSLLGFLSWPSPYLPLFSPYTNPEYMRIALDLRDPLRSPVMSDPRFLCLADAYGITWEDLPGGKEIQLKLSRLMNLRLLIGELSRIPGVAEVRPSTNIYDPGPPPETCVRRGTGPGAIEYRVSDQRFLSTSSGVVRRVDPDEGLPEPGPWICTALQGGSPASVTVAAPASCPAPALALESASELGAAPRASGGSPAPRSALRSALLPAEQVACRRDQLRELLDRTEVRGPDGAPPARPHSLLVSSGDPAGLFDGLLVGLDLPRVANPGEGGAPGGPERLLAFHLGTSIRDLLLNPERPPLDQVVLARERSGSVLVPPGDPFEVSVGIDPTLRDEAAGGGSTRPADVLTIDDLAAPPDGRPGDRSADTKPGRGLTAAGLTDLCHARLDGFDRRILSVLQRTLRADLVDPDGSGAPNSQGGGTRYETRIGLYRILGDELHPHYPVEYGADVYLVDPASGERLPGRLVFDARFWLRIEDGVLVPDVLQLIYDGPEGAVAPVTGTVAIRKPSFAGAAEPGAVLGALSVDEPGAAVEISWPELLAGTTW